MKEWNINIGFHGEVDFNHPSSVSGIIVNTAQNLSNYGYCFNIYCDFSHNQPILHKFSPYIKAHSYHNTSFKKDSRLYIWHKLLWISERLAKTPAQVIHIHQKTELVIGYSFLKRTSIPLVFHINSHPKAWVGSRYVRAFKKSDTVLAASKFIEKRLIKKFPFLSGKTNVLYNGVDTKIFSPGKKSQLSDKKREKFQVFFAGNIWIEKGFDVLLEAAKELCDEDITFLVAGNFEPIKNRLHSEFRQNSPPNVEYIGLIKHDNLPFYYANADISIVPSRWEDPCPLVVMESLACGTPVIGSRIGGIPELIEDGIVGVLITPGSVKELVDAIRMFKRNPQKVKEMGILSRRKAKQFDWKYISDRLMRVYEKFLTKGN